MNKIQRRRASVVCLHKDQLLLVKLRDPKTGVLRFFPPGGKIEINETPAKAAARECLEETGQSVDIVEARKFEDHYDFEWNGRVYECFTTYFLAELSKEAPKPIDDVLYNEGYAWLQTDLALSELAFDKNIQTAVASFF